MCDRRNNEKTAGMKTIAVAESVGMALAHDITEIRRGDFKGRAFKRGHIVRVEDVSHLQRLGKERLYVLEIGPHDMHEDDAAIAMAEALRGSGVRLGQGPSEGKLNLHAASGGLLKVHREALTAFNMLGDVMCATMHTNSVVTEEQTVAGTRAIPLVVKKSVVAEAVRIARDVDGIVKVLTMRKPHAGVVITGNEVYSGKIRDAFEPVIRKKIRQVNGEILGVHFAPDDAGYIAQRMRELLRAGADLIVSTGGMSVDPDDVTRQAIRSLGVEDFCYGSPVLPGAMFLIAYLDSIPIVGIPACGMYADKTIFDLILPRVLTDERIGRRELAELGHGGYCFKCETCRFPICPFGK